MPRFVLIAFFSLIILILGACGGGGDTASGKDNEYDSTKKMMVDILQTDEGKKALIETLNDEDMRQQLVIESDVVRKSINDMLTSEKSSEMWTKLFKDPTFVESYAESMEKENIDLMKGLMNDSEYQQQMLELLQNPEFMNQILTLLKSQQFRAHLEETIQQTLDNPLFQAKITEVLLKAAEKQQGQQGQSEQQGGGAQSGEQGEGGQEGGGGGQ